MRIEVLGYDTISAQARTYAEYRLFAELSRVADTNRVRHARLVLRRRKDEQADRKRVVHGNGGYRGRRPATSSDLGRSSIRGDQPRSRATERNQLATEGC